MKCREIKINKRESARERQRGREEAALGGERKEALLCPLAYMSARGGGYLF